MAITEVELTDEERKWAAHMIRINKEVIDRHYVAQGPDGQKYWVCVYGNHFRPNDGITYEAWSPITD
ncbi:MAG TPA: hypothetical protein VIY48_00825, partial [Candidatus Paceibacterota bacterium]